MALPRPEEADASKQPAELLELKVEVSRAEVRRYMGYPRGRRPAAGVSARLDELLPLLQRLPHLGFHHADRLRHQPSDEQR
jgi:hypothetical protein